MTHGGHAVGFALARALRADLGARVRAVTIDAGGHLRLTVEVPVATPSPSAHERATERGSAARRRLERCVAVRARVISTREGTAGTRRWLDAARGDVRRRTALVA